MGLSRLSLETGSWPYFFLPVTFINATGSISARRSVTAFGTRAGEGPVKNKQCKSMVPFGPHLNLTI